MKNLKQQFIELKNNTPKHTQWILLGAAFVVVTILLVLLLTHKSDNSIAEKDNEDILFIVDPKEIVLTDIEVGSYSNKSIDVSTNVPVIIKNIETSAKGITTTNTCDNKVIDFCTINVIYRPTVVQTESTTTLKINWYGESDPEIVKTSNVSLTYSSWKKQEEKNIQPIVIEEEPEEIEDIEDVDEMYEPEEIYEPYMLEEPELEPIKAVDDIKNIAVENPFKQPEQEPEILQPEKCSEFAIPGYDQSGRQIGWIKPEHGANYFHPFSDKDCSKPTGKYDFATGVITSLKDGSKIGTDSDHIGYRNVRTRNLNVPQLTSPDSSSASAKNGSFGDNAVWAATDANGNNIVSTTEVKKFDKNAKKDWDDEALLGSSDPKTGEAIISSRPYDRTFILRQFKPIPATIVSEVRADPSVYGCDKSGQNCDKNKNYSVPVRATVDRNVYSDDGRTIILPTGTLLLGYLDGKLPGPYQAFGRMNIKWYQFIRPDGVEFNFGGDGDQDPYSADAQGRMGVPGHGSTDYVEQMVMPILTALVPAAVNMIAPITDTVINQIDLDNNTIVQSGTIRSSEMAKQDIINTWNKITQKLLVDAIDNTVPPFSIAAGTRINVFSPVDLIVTCDKGENAGKKCAFASYNPQHRRNWSKLKDKAKPNPKDPSWVGQIRSFNLNQYCKEEKGKITINDESGWAESGYDYRTVLAYCESQNYQAKNMAKQDAYNTNVQQQAKQKQDNYGITQNWTDDGWDVSFSDNEKQQAYNQDILGLTYDDAGNIENPWAKKQDSVIVPVDDVVSCGDGSAPDANGCCTGEIYTNMGESYIDENGSHFACCPESDPGGDCFPPINLE